MNGGGIHWAQLRLGILVTTVITTSTLIVFFIDDVRASFEDTYTLYFHTFTNQTLQPRAPVWLAGTPVGMVRGVEFLPPHGESDASIRVELQIDRGVQSLIADGSSAQVMTSGIVGQTVVNIVPARAGTPLPDRGQLPTAISSDPQEMVRRLETLQDTMLEVKDLWLAVHAAAYEGAGTLARFRRNPDELLSFKERMGSLAAAFDTLGIAATSLSGLLTDPEVRAALSVLGPRFEELAARLEASPYAGPAGEGRITDNLNSVMTRARNIERRIQTGGGTIGRALNDRALQDELRRTRQMLESLRADLRAAAGGN